MVVDDTHHVSILGPPAVEIYDVSIHPQNTVRGDEKWECRFSIRNVGDSLGTFKIEVTGDNILELPDYPPFSLLPGEWIRNEPSPFIGIGPGNITIKCLLVTLGQGESYDVNVGEGGGAARLSQNTLAGESFDVIVGSGTGTPEARLINPNFPTAGQDEPWQGTIELHNVGARTGWFFLELKGNISGSGLARAPPGYALLYMRGIGPATFTIYWHAVEWVEMDSVAATIGPHVVTGAGGELRNLVVSKEYVQDGEGWIGGIQVWNIGDASGNFRVAFTGDITGTSPTFALGPMEHAAVYFEDIGPKVFTITAQREVDGVWVNDDSRDAEAYKRANCMTRIYYVGLKHGDDASYAVGARMEVGDHVFTVPAGLFSYYLAEGKPYWLQIRHMGQPVIYGNVAWVTPPGQDWVMYNYGINILNWSHPHPWYP